MLPPGQASYQGQRTLAGRSAVVLCVTCLTCLTWLVGHNPMVAYPATVHFAVLFGLSPAVLPVNST
jgi:hypothetical protein